MITATFKELWPTLTVVGEEEVCLETPSYRFANHVINKDIFPVECLVIEDEELELEHTCVWVDPLDATLSYTQG
jgi:hypothetical protein